MKYILLLLLVLLARCGVAVIPDTPMTPTVSASSITIHYIGHSSFYLVAQDGTRIVTDPYGPEVPYPFPKGIVADLITVSHSHADHTAVQRVNGSPVIVRDLTPTTVGQVKATGYPALHGANMGPNIIYVFRIGDFKIVHLGELGKIESPETLAAIQDADVMIVPIGVYGAMSFEQLNALVDQVRAQVLLPSHYSLYANARWYNMATVDEYLAALPAGTKVIHDDQVIVEQGMSREVVVLSQWTPE